MTGWRVPSILAAMAAEERRSRAVGATDCDEVVVTDGVAVVIVVVVDVVVDVVAAVVDAVVVDVIVAVGVV